MELRAISTYAHELKQVLPRDAFAPDPWPLLRLPLHLGIIVVSMIAIRAHLVPWPIALVLSLVIGVSFAALTFLGHETLHDAVTRNHVARYLVGFIGFLPFVVSPRLWIAWHNRIHHPHANQPGIDPDAAPTLGEYRASARIRFVVDHLALGRRSVTGWLSLLIGFSVQSVHVLFSAGRRRYLSPSQHALAVAETLLGVALWAGLFVLVGPRAFLLVFVLPLVVANAIVLSFIITNHGLSPLTTINDPLVNSLSVTVPRFVDWLTLNFGAHVEHHLFPTMASRHFALLGQLVRERWPERYQSLSFLDAIARLHRTGRVYKDDITLCDPRTGKEWLALLPGMAQPDAVHDPAQRAASHQADSRK